MIESEILNCTKNISDNIFIENGRMSFCFVKNRPHAFIFVESGVYQGNTWHPDEKNIKLAFSYVPESVFDNVSKVYEKNSPDQHQFINSRSSLSQYFGYTPFLFTKSYIVDTWKLTDQFVRVRTKVIKNWNFNRFPKYKTYNIVSLIPFFGTTDCIGYSFKHWKEASC